MDDLVPLEEFDYHNNKMGCLLKESMDEVFFHGVSVSHVTLSDMSMMVKPPVRNKDTSINRTAGTTVIIERRAGTQQPQFSRLVIWCPVSCSCVCSMSCVGFPFFLLNSPS